MNARSAYAAILLAVGLAPACGEPAAQAAFPESQLPLVQRILVADDARGRGDEALAPLLDGIGASDPAVRRLAVRGLGRLEHDSLASEILPLLSDSVAAVRAEAANAYGQAVRHVDVAATREPLVARLEVEPSPYVRGLIAQTLGRLSHGSAREVIATATLLANVDAGDGDSALAALAKGFNHLARQSAARDVLPQEAVGRIRALTSHGAGGGDPWSRRVRSVSAAALAAARAADAQDLRLILQDPEPLVRREAVLAAVLLADTAAGWAIAGRALTDTAGAVRYDALRGYARLAPADSVCAATLRAVRDDDRHVRLLALDLAGTACSADAAAAVLDSAAATLDAAGDAWHVPAHALVALATLDPTAARSRIPNLAANASPFARSFAARAATAAADPSTLRRLAVDPHPNVRTDAIGGLVALGEADAQLLIDQLPSDDGQLLITVAAALEGTTDTAAVPALLEALDRITQQQRETSRDARTAMLRRIGELGRASDAGQVQPYLRDFDPAVAALTAEVLEQWGEAAEPDPQPLPLGPVPTPAGLDSMARAEVVLVMEGGGEISLRLMPWLAPTNAARFVRLAREGYYDGLTFHRVVPNFVVQGGSPSANEYAGDGPYTRDELSLEGNWRGTVGLSTRGRDTGDAQLYINLVDNIRLDHDYTVFAEVVRGMDIVDALLEGAVIREVRVQ